MEEKDRRIMLRQCKVVVDLNGIQQVVVVLPMEQVEEMQAPLLDLAALAVAEVARAQVLELMPIYLFLESVVLVVLD
jgi:hypothetical protein